MHARFSSSPLVVAAVGALSAVTLAPLAPATAGAQLLTLETRAGMSPVVRKYGSALGSGYSFGVGAGLRVGPTLVMRLDGDVSSGYGGTGSTSPDIYTAMVGLATELLPARDTRAPVHLDAIVSGGLAQIRFNGESLNPVNTIANADARSTFRPMVGAGVRLGVDVTRNMGVFGGATLNAIVLGRYNDKPEAWLGDGGGFLMSLPIVAGLRIGF